MKAGCTCRFHMLISSLLVRKWLKDVKGGISQPISTNQLNLKISTHRYSFQVHRVSTQQLFQVSRPPSDSILHCGDHIPPGTRKPLKHVLPTHRINPSSCHVAAKVWPNQKEASEVGVFFMKLPEYLDIGSGHPDLFGRAQQLKKHQKTRHQKPPKNQGTPPVSHPAASPTAVLWRQSHVAQLGAEHLGVRKSRGERF